MNFQLASCTIMLAKSTVLRWKNAPILHVSYYAKNYAGIICQGLTTVKWRSQGVWVRSENGEKSPGVKTEEHYTHNMCIRL